MSFSSWPLPLPKVDSAEGPIAKAALTVVAVAGRVLVPSAPLVSLLFAAQLFDIAGIGQCGLFTALAGHHDLAQCIVRASRR